MDASYLAQFSPQNMIPPLDCAHHVARGLARGEAVRNSVLNFCEQSGGEFSNRLRASVGLYLLGEKDRARDLAGATACQRLLWRILVQGLDGQSIGAPLEVCIREMQSSLLDQTERQLQTLPLRLLMPLILLLFPAFLIVLLGPLILQFTGGFS